MLPLSDQGQPMAYVATNNGTGTSSASVSGVPTTTSMTMTSGTPAMTAMSGGGGPTTTATTSSMTSGVPAVTTMTGGGHVAGGTSTVGGSGGTLEKKRPNKSLESSGFRSFVAGLSAGMASTVAGYVPDTIKVRLQTQPLSEPVRYKGALDCGIRMIREEGARSLFRGMSTPLMSRAIVNGMCFSTYTLTMKMMYPEGGWAPLPAVFFAGGCAGATSAIIASPTELIKVQMQLGNVVGGPFHHMSHLTKQFGIAGLLRLGMVPTILRDFVCMGTFFVTTSEFSRVIAAQYPNSPVSHVAALLGGAMAGVAGWALCYPLDVWKSNVQQHFENPTKAGIGHTPNSHSFFAFFRERFQRRGIRGLYTGLGPTLFRAVPVNATKYFAFDLVIRIFNMRQL